MKTGHYVLIIAILLCSFMRLKIKTLNHKLDEATNTIAEKTDVLEMKEKDNEYLKGLAEKTQAVQIDSCEDATKKVLVAKKTMERLQEFKNEVCTGIVDMPRYLQDPVKHFTVEVDEFGLYNAIRNE